MQLQYSPSSAIGGRHSEVFCVREMRPTETHLVAVIGVVVGWRNAWPFDVRGVGATARALAAWWTGRRHARFRRIDHAVARCDERQGLHAVSGHRWPRVQTSALQPVEAHWSAYPTPCMQLRLRTRGTAVTRPEVSFQSGTSRNPIFMLAPAAFLLLPFCFGNKAKRPKITVLSVFEAFFEVFVQQSRALSGIWATQDFRRVKSEFWTSSVKSKFGAARKCGAHARRRTATSNWHSAGTEA